MMGAGKTTVGRLLAQELGWSFWDNDQALEQMTGSNAAEIQRDRGQPALHRLEFELLREALRTPEPTVFAAAGSVVLHPDALRGAVAVWLRASERVDERHIASSGQLHRPLPADARSTLEHLGTERASEYGRMADLQVDVASDAPATCERVLEALTARRLIPER